MKETWKMKVNERINERKTLSIVWNYLYMKHDKLWIYTFYSNWQFAICNWQLAVFECSSYWPMILNDAMLWSLCKSPSFCPYCTVDRLHKQVFQSTQLEEISSPSLALCLEVNFKKSYLFLSLPFAWDALHFHYNSLRDSAWQLCQHVCVLHLFMLLTS